MSLVSHSCRIPVARVWHSCCKWNSIKINVTSKYFSFFNNKPPASWVTHITKNFFTCYSYSYYSSMVISYWFCSLIWWQKPLNRRQNVKLNFPKIQFHKLKWKKNFVKIEFRESRPGLFLSFRSLSQHSEIAKFCSREISILYGRLALLLKGIYVGKPGYHYKYI